MGCFRKLLSISCRDHITNKEVKTRIESAIRPYEDLLISMKRRKLKWHRHVTRPSGQAKPAKLSYVEQYKGKTKRQTEETMEDRENDWKKTSGSGLALNGTSYCGKLRTTESGGSW